MPICPFCSQKSRQLGEKCSCGAGYTVHTNHGNDTLGLLGKLIANKFIPTAVFADNEFTIYYEAYQPAVDRVISLIVIRAAFFNKPEKKAFIDELFDKCSGIKQQNTPNLLEVLDLSDIKCVGVTYEAIKGEPLLDYLRKHTPDPVALMHIIHQLLQGIAAHHQRGIRFPGIKYSNLRLFRSGTDEFFLKLSAIIDNVVKNYDKSTTILDDVYDVGQLALSMLTGKPMPIDNLEFPPDRAYLLPIAQIFMRAIAPENQRFASCIELLQAFETAFDLNSHESERPGIVVAAPKVTQQRHSNVTLEQIVWMHRPPVKH